MRARWVMGFAVLVAACASQTAAPKAPAKVPAKVEARAVAYGERADREFKAGNRELAFQLATHALVLRLGACGFDCPESAASFQQIGDLRSENGQPEWAAAAYFRALQILRPFAQTHASAIDELRQRLSRVCRMVEKPTQACESMHQ